MANGGTFTASRASVHSAATQRVRAHDPDDKRVFDRLTKLVSALLDVPMSLLLVSDADQLLLASQVGKAESMTEIEELPILHECCRHTLGSLSAFVIEDVRTDTFDPGLPPAPELDVVAYLGVPLLTLAGDPIGILCAIDFVPRKWSDVEIRIVEDLAATVMAYVEARPAPPDTSLSGGLNIAAVSQRTGVASDTLRKWERRYGVLRPRRTPGGQRRYDELDVARVEWLRDRLGEGFRIGAAAALLAPANRDSSSTAHTTDELVEALVAAARAGDPDRLSGLVDQALTLHPFATVIEDVVTPALAKVGDGWRSDSGAIGDEHMLSEIVRARLERMLSDRRAGVRGKVVLSCAPGERHELGLLALAVLLQADGWLIAYLGADAPLESALALGRRLDADAVCVSVTMPAALERLTAELDAAPAGGPLVVAGGPAVSGATELDARVLGGSLTDIVEQLRAA
jgi:MerR family transcriptional regulator, light-induced transcriptional regulator